MIDSRAIGGAVIRKSVVINSSQTWTAPANLAGNTVWITGCAAGGSGAQNGYLSGSDAYGGFGGCFVEKYPVQVTPSTGYAVVIGAGGAGVTSGNGQSGGDTTFGSLLTIKGGDGGESISTSSVLSMQRLSQKRGVRPAIIDFSASPYLPIQIAEIVNGNVCGDYAGATDGDGEASGGAAGYFGGGGNSAASSSTINATAATANSGAGGGCGYGASPSTSGAGGSGRLIIEWEEYL